MVSFLPRSRRLRARRLAVLVAVVAAIAVPTAAPTLAATPLRGIVRINAGASNTCALLASSQARCWGFNEDGELGDGTTKERLRPRVVVSSSGSGPLTGIRSVAVGGVHSCFVLKTDRAKCTGLNAFGSLGDGTTTPRSRPVTVRDAAGTSALRGIVSIAAGYVHTCAVLRSGKARCWGTNTSGQLGDRSTNERHLPVLVRRSDGSALTGIVSMAAGTDHTCALLRSGKVACWGAKAYLGDGSLDDRPFARSVLDRTGNEPLSGVTAIEAGESSTCARLSSGRLVCWGVNSSGQLGDGTTDPRAFPVRVRTPSGSGILGGVAQVSVGGSSACARTTARRVLCWGSDGDGQLGDGTPGGHRALPRAVRTASGATLTGVAQVSVGVGFTCARLTSGRARCWGDNDFGYLGDGTKEQRLFPVFVSS